MKIVIERKREKQGERESQHKRQILQVDKLNSVCRFFHKVPMGRIEAVLPERETEKQTMTCSMFRQITLQLESDKLFLSRVLALHLHDSHTLEERKDFKNVQFFLHRGWKLQT